MEIYIPTNKKGVAWWCLDPSVYGNLICFVCWLSLQHFVGIVEDMISIVDMRTLGAIAARFLTSIPASPKKAVITEKLQLLVRLADTKLLVQKGI